MTDTSLVMSALVDETDLIDVLACAVASAQPGVLWFGSADSDEAAESVSYIRSGEDACGV